MPKSNSKSQTSIQAMISEGKDLGAIWKKRMANQRRTFTSDTNPEGFDTRLGKLLQQLKASSSMDSGQISREVLTAHGLHVIDRRRRSEALWFVENEVECKEFIKASKKGFTSLTALQAAMRKASKEAKAPTATFDVPDVFAFSASKPTAVLLSALFASSDLYPKVTL